MIPQSVSLFPTLSIHTYFTRCRLVSKGKPRPCQKPMRRSTIKHLYTKWICFRSVCTSNPVTQQKKSICATCAEYTACAESLAHVPHMLSSKLTEKLCLTPSTISVLGRTFATNEQTYVDLLQTNWPGQWWHNNTSNDRCNNEPNDRSKFYILNDNPYDIM